MGSVSNCRSAREGLVGVISDGFPALFGGRREVVGQGVKEGLRGGIFASEGIEPHGMILKADLGANEAMLPGGIDQVLAAEHDGLTAPVGAAQIDECA